MPVFDLPEPLFPRAFDDKKLYKAIARLPLYCALASTAPFLLFPKASMNTARCDVPKFFAARYFSDDEETAIREFEHRWRLYEVSSMNGLITLKQWLAYPMTRLAADATRPPSRITDQSPRN